MNLMMVNPYSSKLKLLVLLLISILSMVGCLVNKANVASSGDMTAKEIVFSVQPGGGPSSSVWAQQPTIEIRNAAGQTISQGADASALVTLSILTGSGQLIGESSAYAVAGKAVFVGLSIDLSANYTLKAVKADVSAQGGTATLETESQSFTISSGALYKIKLSGLSEFDAGTCQPISVESVDSANNPVTLQNDLSIVFTNNGRGSFYTDENCTGSNVVTNISLVPGTSSSRVYFQDLGQESLRLYASVANLSDVGSGSLDIRVKELKVTGHYVSLAGGHSCTAYGRIVFCKGGDNPNSELGYSTFESPRALLLPSSISEIAVSLNGACALTVIGEVWCWGWQSNLNLKYDSPTKISDLGTTAKQIVAGVNLVTLGESRRYESHFCALSQFASVNTVKCWGHNTSRGLGDGTNTFRTGVVTAVIPLDAGDFVVRLSSSSIYTYAITNLGKVFYWGRSTNPTLLSGASNVRDVFRYGDGYFSSYDSTCLVHLNNTVSCFGTGNGYGQLGVGDFVSPHTTPVLVSGLTNVKSVSVGLSETYFVKGDGTLYRSGTNFYSTPALTSPRGNVPVMSFRYSQTEQGVSIPENIDVPAILAFNDSNKISAYVEGKLCAVSEILNDVVCITNRQQTPTLEFVKIVPYQNLQFFSPVRLIERDTCQEFTVSLQNNGLERAASYDFNLSAKDHEGTGRFYFDSACTKSTSVFQFRKGNSRTKIYYKAVNLGTKTKQSIISLNSNDGVTGTFSYAVQVSGRPYQIASFRETSESSNAYRLVILDQSFNPTFSDFEFSAAVTISHPQYLSLHNEIGYTTPHANNYTFPINVNGINMYLKSSVPDCGYSTVTFVNSLLSISSYQIVFDYCGVGG